MFLHILLISSIRTFYYYKDILFHNLTAYEQESCNYVFIAVVFQIIVPT